MTCRLHKRLSPEHQLTALLSYQQPGASDTLALRQRKATHTSHRANFTHHHSSDLTQPDQTHTSHRAKPTLSPRPHHQATGSTSHPAQSSPARPPGLSNQPPPLNSSPDGGLPNPSITLGCPASQVAELVLRKPVALPFYHSRPEPRTTCVTLTCFTRGTFLRDPPAQESRRTE